ncbi:hypothetical protein CASFOL_039199 [Castilleja foliolosa]|uniref:Uncharacterized protein n=1 Tax=Castilleja foliolosa TaxID=1961234 RepID=A0ABD3BHB9_9LAMI
MAGSSSNLSRRDLSSSPEATSRVQLPARRPRPRPPPP